jgi:hypothetical protein
VSPVVGVENPISAVNGTETPDNLGQRAGKEKPLANFYRPQRDERR